MCSIGTLRESTKLYSPIDSLTFNYQAPVIEAHKMADKLSQVPRTYGTRYCKVKTLFMGLKPKIIYKLE